MARISFLALAIFLGINSFSFARDVAQFESDFVESHDPAVAAGTYHCASGGPVTERFYEQMYLSCKDSYCPSKCGASGGRVDGKYFSNAKYPITCICY